MTAPISPPSKQAKLHEARKDAIAKKKGSTRDIVGAGIDRRRICALVLNSPR